MIRDGATCSRGCMPEEGDSLFSIRAYYLNQGGGNDGLHAPINNWFYWSWNANSGDTGGIVRCPATNLNPFLPPCVL